MPFHCTVCGELHDELPDIASDRPDQWWSVAETERNRRIQLTSDTCIIDHIDRKDYFIRGVLELPIPEQQQRFGFGVWVSQKRENFLAYRQNPNTDAIGPFFGWLCTRIAYYKEDTLSLKTKARFSADNQRPKIELEPTDHPLAVDQRHGITLAKAWEIVHYYQERSNCFSWFL